MALLSDVFRLPNEMTGEGVIGQYAIGGATAVLFYAEPTRTYDLDVFVVPADRGSDLAPLSRIYDWGRTSGFAMLGEHMLVHDVPVQFLPVHSRLAEEAVVNAKEIDYEGVKVRVIDPDYLVALALQAGGARRRERAWQLFESGQVDRSRLRALFARHGITAEIPDDV